MTEILSVFMNLLMAGLLLATIIYCLKLNKRIKVLQDSKSELARIIREFDESTKRATQSINEIHAATMRISDNIQHKIDRANYLADDLQVLIDKGNKMSGKADVAPAQSRPAPQSREPLPQRSINDFLPARSQEATARATPQPGNDEASGRRPLRMRSRAEQELMSLLGGKKQNESGG